MSECDDAPYDIGDEVVVTAEFTDGDPQSATYGELVDPTTVVAYSKSPSGTVAPLVVTKAAVGIYQATITPDAAGRWDYRFEGSGENVGVQEDWFRVKSPNIVVP